MKSLITLFLLLVAYVCADMYMHNPRGSNDRLNEANENRNNGDRMFDSQNNAKGGYCYGPAMSYYEGSQLTVEWTNQHGCSYNPNYMCNIVLQYMCSNSNDPPTILVRDGTTTDTITDTATGPTATNAAGDLLFGMHEPRTWYDACQTRQRNKGLYIADRADPNVGNLNGDSATVTRQNNNGGQRGYECPEERDYYPYWVASPWKDVAIMVQDTSLCGFYQSHSQNVISKNQCQDTAGNQAAPNNEAACISGKFNWVTQPAWNIPPPACLLAPWSRDNHLGNTFTGAQAHFNWTLPTSGTEPCIANNNCNCVLRIRYNISTYDFGPNGNRPDTGFIDWNSNAAASPVKNRNTVGAILYQDGNPFELATDTSQFGRTFQDRSYMFHIRPRPTGVNQLNRIWNLNVRGKRGNIVQAYPATEYDFTPTYLYVRVGDYIHFQWTGCDTNPAGNAGEGTAGTDRSNIVELANFADSLPASDSYINSVSPLFESQGLRTYMAYLGQTNCLTYGALLVKNNNNQNNVETDPQNCMKLNAAPAYFDAGLVMINKTGTHYFMSARNNNFSNRGQKGEIDIVPLLPVWAIVIVCFGAVAFAGSGVIAGLVLYARSHPLSRVANFFGRL